jgi:hypothetical protein
MNAVEPMCAKTYMQFATEVRCQRRGLLEEDGKLWCRQHTPSLMKARGRMRLAGSATIRSLNTAKSASLELVREIAASTAPMDMNAVADRARDIVNELSAEQWRALRRHGKLAAAAHPAAESKEQG